MLRNAYIIFFTGQKKKSRRGKLESSQNADSIVVRLWLMGLGIEFSAIVII